MTLRLREQLVTDLRYTGDYGNTKQFVTIHQTGNPGYKANAAAHANLQSRLGLEDTSWHWTVDDTEAVQSYSEDVKCFHAGDGRYGTGNISSIAIEICINYDGDYDKAFLNGAKLAASRMKANNIPLGNLVQHNYWSGKNCPAEIRDRGQWFIFENQVAKFMGVSGNIDIPPTSVETDNRVVVDGYWGRDTTTALQIIYGTLVDGEVSSQPNIWHTFNPALTAGWDWVVNPEGSMLIRAMQSRLGLTMDGLIGPNTIRGIQRRMGTVVDGVFDAESPAIKALQKSINKELTRIGR